jgi:hypothetical protein
VLHQLTCAAPTHISTTVLDPASALQAVAAQDSTLAPWFLSAQGTEEPKTELMKTRIYPQWIQWNPNPNQLESNPNATKIASQSSSADKEGLTQP